MSLYQHETRYKVAPDKISKYSAEQIFSLGNQMEIILLQCFVLRWKNLLYQTYEVQELGQG